MHTSTSHASKRAPARRKSLKSMVEQLNCEYVNSQTRTIEDWAAALGEDGETVEAIRCETCGEIIQLRQGEGDCKHSDHDPDSDCDGYLSLAEGAMMNYFYALDHGGDAAPLVDLPLCLVTLSDGIKGLALTGGGMDLSPQICAAYVALGFLPPVHFVDSYPESKDRSPLVYEACLRACEVSSQWALSAAERLREAYTRAKRAK